MPLIALSEITADQRAQPRTSIMVDKVGEYTEDMQRGDKFPPAIVFFDGQKHWLADGFHRYYAATAAQRLKLECVIRDGGLRDAILYSCSANAAHGLRRTNDDKRRAVAKLVEDDEWSQWSDAEIARKCAVSHVFVGKIRKEAARFSHETVTSEKRSYRTKHGTVAVMKTASIGVVAPEIENGLLLAKSLHEIERHIDMMPSPTEAVANFPADQHYLFPVSKLARMAIWLSEFAEAWRTKIREKAHAGTG